MGWIPNDKRKKPELLKLKGIVEKLEALKTAQAAHYLSKVENIKKLMELNAKQKEERNNDVILDDKPANQSKTATRVSEHYLRSRKSRYKRGGDIRTSEGST